MFNMILATETRKAQNSRNNILCHFCENLCLCGDKISSPLWGDAVGRGAHSSYSYQFVIRISHENSI